MHAGIPTPGKADPPAQCMLCDTVNKRAVCILLECNLVYFFFVHTFFCSFFFVYVSLCSHELSIFTGRNEVVAKVIFLHLFVILFTGGVLPQCMLGYHPPWDQADPPQEQADPPQTRQTPSPGTGRPPPDQADPPREADSSIRSTSGRYASYWNAFLLSLASTMTRYQDRNFSLWECYALSSIDTHQILCVHMK